MLPIDADSPALNTVTCALIYLFSYFFKGDRSLLNMLQGGCGQDSKGEIICLH